MKRLFVLGILRSLIAGSLAAISTVWSADLKPLYQQEFTQLKLDQVPDEIMILDGQFSVKEEGGNKFLELPGAPLETFGILFGPSEASGIQVQARVQASKQGRKFPTFSAGLNGVGGYKLRVVPAKGAIELVRGDDIKSSTPFEWKSGDWTFLKLQIRIVDGTPKIQGKAWQGSAEPKTWMITVDDKEASPPGKAGVWGMPFSGTPIRFDDLRVVSAE